MGKLITTEQFERRVSAEKLKRLCGSEGAEKNAVAEEIIARAEALVDAYLRGRYAEISPCPILEEWVLAIAERELYKRGPGDKAPEKIESAYQETVRRMKDAASGLLSLPLRKSSGGSGSLGGLQIRAAGLRQQ